MQGLGLKARASRAYRCTGSAAGERGQRSALSFCLSVIARGPGLLTSGRRGNPPGGGHRNCTGLQLPARAFVGSVDPVCPGLTAPGALPLAQRLRLPPGPTTVVAPEPLPGSKTNALSRRPGCIHEGTAQEQDRGHRCRPSLASKSDGVLALAPNSSDRQPQCTRSRTCKRTCNLCTRGYRRKLVHALGLYPYRQRLQG